jgi:hypothetical protein
MPAYVPASRRIYHSMRTGGVRLLERLFECCVHTGDSPLGLGIASVPVAFERAKRRPAGELLNHARNDAGFEHQRHLYGASCGARSRKANRTHHTCDVGADGFLGGRLTRLADEHAVVPTHTREQKGLQFRRHLRWVTLRHVGAAVRWSGRLGVKICSQPAHTMPSESVRPLSGASSRSIPGRNRPDRGFAASCGHHVERCRYRRLRAPATNLPLLTVRD